MSNDILVLAEHDGQAVSDITFELLGAARRLASGSGGQVAVALVGGAGLTGTLGAASTVYVVDGTSGAIYSPEVFEKAFLGVLKEADPRLVLTGTSTMGIDVAGALSVAWPAPVVSYVVGLEAEGTELVATSQIYGGKLMAEVAIGGPHAICAVIAGSFPADAGRSDGTPEVREVAVAGLDSARTTPRGVHEPDTSGVDIAAAEVLVSVGRGIGGKENLEVVQELADALGAPLAASRPITDQGWLPKPQQVGKSGKKVKPRAYLAFGISGAPEHLEGMRDAELIIACNTDPNAPIFDVAHYGTTADLFDLAPELAEKLGS
ncbi:MAG: electron transfer flavoprotein subunit alpha/FixB family protein [Actinomycetota bacterium]|jgi:electron transfer flavoprotein alpha subunit|nr:electron transfer flavoprotein subunit alpha/FixB family protein [Actinomycetota bacterium]